MRNLLRSLSFAVLLLGFALPALAQDKGSISGKVSDKKTGHALPFATVTVVGAQKGGLTDSEGKFLITGIAPGTYELRVQVLGYAPFSQAGVVVVAGRTQVINVALAEVVVRTEKTVEVSAERRLVEAAVELQRLVGGQHAAGEGLLAQVAQADRIDGDCGHGGGKARQAGGAREVRTRSPPTNVGHAGRIARGNGVLP